MSNCPRLLAVCALAAALLFGFASWDCRAGTLLYTGVNLAGAEFGQNSLPGTYGSSYTYPNAAGNPDEITYFTNKGMNTFRLPFRWERMVRRTGSSPYAPLTYSVANTLGLDATELGRMDAFVNAATAKGAYTIIDPHNFQRYFNPPGPGSQNFQTSSTFVVGSTNIPYDGSQAIGQRSALDSLWSLLANHYKTNDHVIFNLMNEPTSILETNLVNQENSAIAAIRATGAANLILVPGNRYTGAWTWNNSDSNGASNAAAMLSITDPGNNFAFDMHQYFDTDGSGTHDTIDANSAATGVNRITAATNWLEANGRRGFLGEFAVDDSQIGSGASQIGDELLVNMLTYMQNHSTAWIGWAWWGGGPWWGNNSRFDIDQTGNAEEVTLTTIKPFLVPEPGSFVLGVIGGIALLSTRRFRRHPCRAT